MKFETFKLNEKNLITVVTQDYISKDVLMVAYMNKEAYEKTLETGKAYYYSRSRQSLWQKGETSGHYQTVKNMSIDCDNDTLLLQVEQEGVACHTGEYSCFYRNIKFTEEKSNEGDNKDIIDTFKTVYNVIADRKLNPKEGSYTNYLFDKGIDKILKKVGEETAEVIIAAKNQGNKELIYEMSDLLYHLMVLMVEKDVKWEDIKKELDARK